MRTVDSAHTAALGPDARLHGVVERDLFWLRGLDLEGEPVEYAFWVGRVPVSITVNAGYDGGTDTRVYVGGGALIEVGDIPEGLGLDVRRTPVTLNYLHPRVKDMFRGNYIGLAEAEVHRALLDPISHNLVGTPYVHFQGQVNMAREQRGGIGGDGRITLDIVSDVREFTRSNPAMRGNQTHQRFYPGDAIMRYANEASTWAVPWGAANTGGRRR